MKGLFVYILFALAIVALFIAGRLGWGRRLALGFCMMATTMGCGGMAMPGDGNSAQSAPAGKSDPLKIGKTWQDYAAEAQAVDQLTSGKFDHDVYNKAQTSLGQKAQALKNAVADKSQAERNAVDMLTSMYSILLFDWFATNSMITCYAPRLAPTEPLEIARTTLNGRITSLHRQFAQGKMDRKAYVQALTGMVPEAAAGLDKETQEKIKALLMDING